MGLTGELVKSVFSRNRSVGPHEKHARNFGADRRRWRIVRSYFCADEFNSVLAEGDDSTYGWSSQATITHPVTEASEYGTEECECHSAQEDILSSKCLEEYDAAIVIQSAFRGFLTRRLYEKIKQSSGRDSREDVGDHSEVSVDTSIEVQMGDSVYSLQTQGGGATLKQMQQNIRRQVSKLKEEWDDSTVSSNISKLRLQNRLEAMTRRERALAYAFSQQLRICSTKKKQIESSFADSNAGWSWLERWMATRMPENPYVQDHRSAVIKKKFSVLGELKESCGSNDVSVGFDSLTKHAHTAKDCSKTTKSRLKPTRSTSQNKTSGGEKRKRQMTKVMNHSGGTEKEKREKQMQPRCMEEEIKCKDASDKPSDSDSPHL
ncbi:Protein IQ-DOMAIN 14 [Acorus calamus]|uniref:Protein IQ-DOMAIN 14 n=1 Tax=Acorus calamus TaxID=4465 RepID=A0AAV9ESA9_ACOCL|nr:Protein IQ-DOMAIN 14 [Acorus calamus]